jgi:hypothetical protein
MNNAENQASYEERLENAKLDFIGVLEIAIQAKNKAHGTPTDRQGVIADTLFLRNILTGITIHQVLNPCSVGNLPRLAFPDFPSVAVLARTILESYLAMHYMAIRVYSAEDREIRLLWWDWHEINERIRTFDKINSKRLEVSTLKMEKTNLAAMIRSHVSYAQIPRRLSKGFQDDELPKKALFESNAIIAKQAGVLTEHFDVQYQLLSSIAHSQPTIVKALSKHNPNTLDATILLIEALQYSAAYLAFTVRDFVKVCPCAKPALTTSFQRFAALWAGIFATPFPEN